jgi:hypothetical protein
MFDPGGGSQLVFERSLPASIHPAGNKSGTIDPAAREMTHIPPGSNLPHLCTQSPCSHDYTRALRRIHVILITFSPNNMSQECCAFV